MSDEFDRLLGESLKSYIETPQRTGLEQRVLMRARETRRRKLRWYLPAFALAAFAAAVMVALWPTAPPRQVLSEQIAGLDVPKSVPTAPVAITAIAGKSRRHRVERQAPLLRAREPLTAQERALLQVAAAQPEQLAWLSKPTELVTVPVIEIKPLSEGEN